MNRNRIITIGVGLCVCLLTAWGQTDSLQASRYLTRAVLYGVGYTNVYDTYLSPQEYKGMEFRISRETMRMTNLWDGNVSSQNFFQANLGYTHNRTDNNNTFSALATWSYGLHYQFRLTENFKLLAGALGEGNIGFVYNLRNSNNPAQARGYVNLDASGMAIWNLKIRNYPLTLRYQANVPVAGVMFSPHAGQSYYEIFTLGNSGGVVKFTSLHNQPTLRQMLTVDLPLGDVRLRCAYVADLLQSSVNGIDTHTYSHVFMVGAVKDLYSFGGRKPASLPSSLRAY